MSITEKTAKPGTTDSVGARRGRLGSSDGDQPSEPGRSVAERLRPRITYLPLGLTALVITYLAIVPVGTMVFASLRSGFISPGAHHWTFKSYHALFTSHSFWVLALHSFEYAIPTAVIATSIGFGLAWLVVRTDTPAKSLTTVAALVPLILPGILNTISWALLLSPHGPINTFLADHGGHVFNIYSVPGMVFVQSLHVSPISFLLGVAAFSAIDGTLEEAAAASGAGPLRTFRSVTLPVILPSILAALLLTIVQTLSSFEVPQLLGVPTGHFVFVTEIYSALKQFPPDYGQVGAIGVFLLVIAMVLLFLSRRVGRGGATVSGKGFRPKVQQLGWKRWIGLAVALLYAFVAVVMPIAMLAWSSLFPTYRRPSFGALKDAGLGNYRQIKTAPGLLPAIKNSLEISLTAAVIVTLLCALVAYLSVKSKLRGRGVLDGLAMTPIAVPSVILGVGILYFYLSAPLPFNLYGTKAILVIAFVTLAMPYGMRYLVPGFRQINSELGEAAEASGASWIQVFVRIYLPLLIPSLTAAFLYSLIVTFREVSAAIFLYSFGSEVVAVKIYELWANGSYGPVAALGVLMVVFLALLAAAASTISARFRIRNER